MMNHQTILCQCFKRLQEESDSLLGINDHEAEISEPEKQKNTAKYITEDKKLPCNHPFQ